MGKVTRLDERAEEGAAAGDAAPKVTLRSAGQVARDTSQPAWLLRPYLEPNSTAVLYGDFGTCKSFIALDWSFRVALGLPALGYSYLRPPAPVVFISAEGRGLQKRVLAWALHEYAHSAALAMEIVDRAPLHFIERPVNLSARPDALALVAAIEATGVTPALIVVDTLSKNSDGRVEASTADAAAYLATIDQFVRARFAACVLLVHHVGHAEKGRPRGPINIGADTDTLLHVERLSPGENVFRLTNQRAKDSGLAEAVALRAVQIHTGRVDEDGEAVTSLAIEHADGVDLAAARPEPKGIHPPALLAGLREWSRSNPGKTHISTKELGDVCKAQGVPRSSKAKAIETLTGLGYLSPAACGHTVNL
jgi:hypothetical protein